jgi:tRNA-specific 2-thiouridylase
VVWSTADDELTVAFARARKAITPGQSLVLYEGDDVIGGGWIHQVGEPMTAN